MDRNNYPEASSVFSKRNHEVKIEKGAFGDDSFSTIPYAKSNKTLKTAKKASQQADMSILSRTAAAGENPGDRTHLGDEEADHQDVSFTLDNSLKKLKGEREDEMNTTRTSKFVKRQTQLMKEKKSFKWRKKGIELSELEDVARNKRRLSDLYKDSYFAD
jgi:hypothetical protein